MCATAATDRFLDVRVMYYLSLDQRELENAVALDRNRVIDLTQRRCAIVLDGRREYTWAKSLGINRGTIQNMKEKGVTPGWETLYATRRAEGVNIEWLMEGVGEPFIVHRYLNDAECAEFVEAHLIDENWTVTLATDWQRGAVILSQPGSSTLQGRAGRVTTYNYTITEIMLGVGKSTLDVVAGKGHRVQLTELSGDNMTAIYRGQVGTYRLLNAPDAWLKNSITGALIGQ